MAKGFFTQGVCVLLKQPLSLSELEALLAEFEIKKRNEDFDHWEFSGPSLVIPFRPEVNGLVVVDTVGQRWPDHMGDPKTESLLFGAWGMGHFGPLTFPQSLARASQHSQQWPAGRTIANEHQGFVRIRTSYVFGVPDSAPVMPKDYAPWPELEFVTKVAKAVLKHPAALCFFNPNGEVLCDLAFMDTVQTHYATKKLPPVNIWTNVRMFKAEDGWMMMDTVGMGQLELEDLEAVFPPSRFSPDQMANFLTNTSLYIAEHGSIIADGNTIDGPGGMLFRCKKFGEAFVTPPRPTLRFRAEDGSTPPKAFGFETKKPWQFWK